MRTPLHIPILLSLLMTFLPSARGAPGDLDMSFNPGSGIDSFVNSVSVQPDGKLIIAGQFTTVAGFVRHHIARLNPDGTGDPTFNPRDGLAESIAQPAYLFATSLQPDGKVLLAGNFTNIEKFPRNGFARLNGDGTLDTNFDTSLAGITCSAVQPDGKIVVGAGGVHRLNPDGTVDQSFQAGAGSSIQGVAIQPDGKILAFGGDLLIRVNADGTDDTNFQPLYVYLGTIYVIALQPDGKILVGGAAETSKSTFEIARFNSDGTLDPTFQLGTNIDGWVRSIALQSDGKILVGGQFQHFNGIGRGGILRLNPNGTLDTNFDAKMDFGVNQVTFVTTQPDDKIFLFGSVGAIAGHYRNNLARLNPDGTLDTGFNPFTGIARARSYPTSAILALPDGKFLARGLWETNGTALDGVMRIDAGGNIDPSFPLLSLGWIPIMTLQPDQKVVMVVSSNTPVTGIYNEQLVRMNQDGTLDPTFNPANVSLDRIDQVLIQADGKLLVRGDVTSIDGVKLNGIARLKSDGSLDSSFNPQLATGAQTAYVDNAAIQPDGKILVSGYRFGAPGFGYFFSRLNADGTIDASFTAPVLGSLGHFAVQPDGKILISVWDYDFNSNTLTRYVARLNSDGSFDPSFTRLDGTYGWPYAVQPDGKIIIGHTFQNAQNVLMPFQASVVRLNSNGTADPSFDPIMSDIYSDESGIIDLTLLPDSKILARGFFTSVDGVARWELARFLGDAPVIITQPASRTNIVGKPASFTVVVSGAAPLSYQWYKNGAPISDDAHVSGTTTSTLTISHARFSDIGAYSVMIRNASGSVTSESASLLVQLPNGKMPGKLTGTIRSLTRQTNGHVHVRYTHTAPDSFIEVSTNLQDWEIIGGWDGSGKDPSEFEDAEAVNFPRRFYRIVSP
jgi:uncharacterized delta-60 repeat protein